jgi:hypothetical protein
MRGARNKASEPLSSTVAGCGRAGPPLPAIRPPPGRAGIRVDWRAPKRTARQAHLSLSSAHANLSCRCGKPISLPPSLARRRDTRRRGVGDSEGSPRLSGHVTRITSARARGVPQAAARAYPSRLESGGLGGHRPRGPCGELASAPDCPSLPGLGLGGGPRPRSPLGCDPSESCAAHRGAAGEPTVAERSAHPAGAMHARTHAHPAGATGRADWVVVWGGGGGGLRGSEGKVNRTPPPGPPSPCEARRDRPGRAFKFRTGPDRDGLSRAGPGSSCPRRAGSPRSLASPTLAPPAAPA